MVLQKTRVSAEEYKQFISLPENRNRRFELIGGAIVESFPTLRHGLIGSNILGPLWLHNAERQLGVAMTPVSYQMPGDNHNIHIPDVSFIAGTESPIVDKGNVPRMPDLAVEVKSRTNTYKELREKAAYYLANGSKLVWLVYSEKRLIEVYTLDGDVDILTEDDTLTGGDVLPGFELSVRDIFKA
jgi:Uma2 family endonuclease